MARIGYVTKNFGPAALQVIRDANPIIAEYAAQGYDLTLRQLYYQFVSRDLIANKQSEYKRLGDIINDARLAGLVDWDAIVDRTRSIRALPHWSDPVAIVQAAASSYAVEKWADQPMRVEVWIEKDALVGVFEPVCEELDIPLFSCRGYTSQSEVWGAAQRLEASLAAAQEVVILHFGDHDPSGLDMTRDIRERLKLFLLHDWIRHEDERHAYTSNQGRRDWLIREHGDLGWEARLDARRLALTWAEVQQYSPPPNPATSTDARYRKYAEEFGHESWGSWMRSSPPCSASSYAMRWTASWTKIAGPPRWNASRLGRRGSRPYRGAGLRWRRWSDDSSRPLDRRRTRAARPARAGRRRGCPPPPPPQPDRLGQAARPVRSRGPRHAVGQPFS
jgi:hypothetical protein